jgi:hypothetical protein
MHPGTGASLNDYGELNRLAESSSRIFFSRISSRFAVLHAAINTDID